MHLLTLFDLDKRSILELFELAARLKSAMEQGVREPMGAGRVLGLLFEKPSLRTRVSFESAMAQIGGSAIYLGADAGWGQRESLEDFARVFSSYVDLIAFRGFAHATLERFAQHCQCPVINALTNESHPCQALGDLFTLFERLPSLAGQKVAFVGDPNNVAHSLAVACAATDMSLTLIGPESYRFSDEFLGRLRSAYPGTQVEQTTDPSALEGAAAVYTDVWCSMGFESEKSKRTAAFSPYQIDQRMMDIAGDQAVFMHCLPARRGEEVTDEVMDGNQSVVVQQAENRMHSAKALILKCLGLEPSP